LARVLLVPQVYRPDAVSTANLMAELAEGLQAAGHQITVLTSIPHYNPPESVRNDRSLTGGLLRPYTDSKEKGIRVLRIYMPRKGLRVWSRLLDYAWFQWAVTVLGLMKAGRQDVVLIVSPPITLGVTGVFLAWVRRAAFVYDVRELWPDVPVQMGMIKNRVLVGFLYALEKFVYRRADAISTIARSFNEKLIARGVAASRIYFTPNFVDVKGLPPGGKTNPFSVEHNLAGSFVVIYAGNIGLTQGLEILVSAARAFVDDTEVRFVVVGDGVARGRLEDAVKEAKLKNFLLLPYQPAERVRDLYASADLHVVPLRAGFAYTTVPSKVYTAMAAGRPVLFAGEPDSEAAQVLRNAQAGVSVMPESVPEIVDAIRRLRADRPSREQMGRNGRKWVEANTSRSAVIATYDRMIQEVSKRAG
jgi:putative colanic acid biosynthesis glycosyltransferase WcaI